MTRRRSGRGRGRPAIVWTVDMLARLRELRERGIPLQACADAIGVDYGTARKRAQIEGLAKPLNRGRLSGEQLMRRQR